MRRPAESAGRELEPPGNCRPRGMVAPKRKFGRQNPAYRLTLHFPFSYLLRYNIDAVGNFSHFGEHGSG